MTTAGSLCSTGVTPLPRYYGPLRLPPTQLTGLWIPLPPPGYKPQIDGPLRFLSFPSLRAARYHPDGPLRCTRWLLHGTCRLHHLRKIRRPSLAFRGRTRFNLSDYGSQLRCPAVSRIRLGFLPRPASLPVLRCLHTTGRSYMSNQQFTWQPPFRSRERPGFA